MPFLSSKIPCVGSTGIGSKPNLKFLFSTSSNSFSNICSFSQQEVFYQPRVIINASATTILVSLGSLNVFLFQFDKQAAVDLFCDGVYHSLLSVHVFAVTEGDWKKSQKERISFCFCFLSELPVCVDFSVLTAVFG